jgi:hypothetical protein
MQLSNQEIVKYIIIIKYILFSFQKKFKYIIFEFFLKTK